MSQLGRPTTAAAAARASAGLTSAYERSRKTRQMRWWHETIIDDMIAFPLSTNKERSSRLGYTPEYIMMLTRSDMFQAAYQARRANMREKLDDSITGKLGDLASLSLDIMKETIEKKRSQIPFRDLAAANDSLLQRLGYGASPAPASGANVQVNVTSGITAEQLASAREKLRATEQQRASEAPKPSAHLHAIDITPASLEERGLLGPARSFGEAAPSAAARSSTASERPSLNDLLDLNAEGVDLEAGADDA